MQNPQQENQVNKQEIKNQREQAKKGKEESQEKHKLENLIEAYDQISCNKVNIKRVKIKSMLYRI